MRVRPPRPRATPLLNPLRFYPLYHSTFIHTQIHTTIHMKRDTAARVNITLPKDLLQSSQVYAKAKGVPFSTLIADLLRQEVGVSETQAPTITTGGTLREVIVDILLTDPEIQNKLKEIFAGQAQPRRTRTPKPPAMLPQGKRLPRGRGRVPITPDLMERVNRWAVKDLTAAMGVTHSVTSKIKRGQPYVSYETYERLKTGLEKLEGNAVHEGYEADEGNE